jgi:hypothetical protein
MIRADEPVTMSVGDWISLAGLVVSVAGFAVVIRELIRIAHSPQAGRPGQRTGHEEADPVAGGSSSS